MAGKRKGMVARAEAVFTADIASNQTIREHLVERHAMVPVEVERLSDSECWEAHDQIHERALGSFWIART
jgi:hypothetical protein